MMPPGRSDRSLELVRKTGNLAIQGDTHSISTDQIRIRGGAGVTNAQFDETSVDALPFPDESFDAVFSHALLEHPQHPVEALREMRRREAPAYPAARGGLLARRGLGVLRLPRHAGGEFLRR